MSTRHPQQVEIKGIIAELERQAGDMQQLRDLLFRLIRSHPGYSDIIRISTHTEREIICKDEHSKVVWELIEKLRHTGESLQRLHSKIMELEALLAPMQYLPDQLLLAIFKAGCRAPRPEPDNRLPFPMLVASVSRRWRSLTLNTPFLWTTLHISMSGPRYWAIMALEHSADRLLDITIDGRAESTNRLQDIAAHGHAEAPSRTSTIIQNMELLLPHSARWRRFTVITHHSIDIRVVGEMLENVSAPNLEHLRLSLTGSGPAGNHEAPLSSILSGGAPMLSSVRLDSVSLPWSSPPLAGLSSIDIRWMWDRTKLMYPQLSNFIAASPRLERLILRGRHVELRPSSSYDPISIPFLRYLELSGDNICRLSSILVTPQLETLALVNVDESEFREFVGWLSCIDIQYLALRYLIFVNVTTCDLSPEFTHASPNIGQLTIINSHSNHFIELLLRHDNAFPNTIIWPLLKTIVLIDDVNYDRLAQMVRKRIAQQAPLQRLILNGIFTHNEPYVSPLRELGVIIDGIAVLEGDM